MHTTKTACSSFFVSSSLIALATFAFALEVRAQEAPAIAAPPDLDEVMAAVDKMAQPLVDDGLTVGMVIGIQRGEERRVRGYGEVTLGGGQTPDEETVYEIGSISKVFTGILLADAVTRDLVTLDDTVQQHYEEEFELPSFEDQPIRLWHLSTHSSGLPRMPSNFKPANPESPYADYTVELMYEGLERYKPRRAPGEKYAYSNLGVGLLGSLLAKVQESDYPSILRTRITEPLGLEDTSIELSERMLEHLAPGYDVDRRKAPNWDMLAFTGAGGIRSNVRDMLRFGRACLHPEEGPLEEALNLSMLVRHREAKGVAIGLGWHASSAEATRWHNGQTGGYHAYFAIWPQSDVAVVLLSNTTSGLLDLCADNALVLLMGHTPREIPYPKPIELDREACAELVGEYNCGLFATLAISLEEGGLFAQMTFQPKLRLYQSAPDAFFYRAVEAQIAFERDEANKVVGLSITQGGVVTKGKRKE